MSEIDIPTEAREAAAWVADYDNLLEAIESLCLRVRAEATLEAQQPVQYKCFECDGPLYGPYCPTCDPRVRAERELAKDEAYHERNQVVAALARLFPSGIARTNIPGWEPEWHGCVYIDLPTGQVSWHYHDREASLFADLPPYGKPWDGHDTPEKYRRLASVRAEREWRPIAELPTDEMLIYCEIDGGKRNVGVAYRSVSGNWNDTESPWRRVNPQYGMPLPSSPKET